MSKKDKWLEPRAYRRLTRQEYRRERMLEQIIQRLAAVVILFAVVVTLLTMHPYLVGQP